MSTSDEELLRRVELPPPSKPPFLSRWLSKLDLLLLLVLMIISAWSFAGYVNTNWLIQAQGNRLNAQSERITAFQKQVIEYENLLRKLQDEQRGRDKELGNILDKINLQLAEIKGAAAVKAGRR